MKKLTITFCFLFFMGAMWAQQSLITVFTDDAENFTLYVDGKQINQTPSSRVAEVEFSNEYSNIRVVFEQKQYDAVKKNIPLKDLDGKCHHSVYVLKKNKKGQYKMRLNSATPYTPEDKEEAVVAEYTEVKTDAKPVKVENKQNAQASITATEKPAKQTSESSVSFNASVKETKNGTTESANVSLNISSDDGENANVTFTINEGNSKSNKQKAAVGMQVNGTSTTTETTSTYSESYSSSSGSYQYSSSSSSVTTSSSGTTAKENTQVKVGHTVEQAKPVVKEERCASAATSTEFDKFVNNIKAQDFDETRLKVAKDIAKNKCLSSAQVHDIIGLFQFEEDQLEFAKYSYKYVYDKDNFYEVYKAFDNSFTVDELKEAIDKE